jgi:predicted transposase/invertase (TIGR01784 family)
MLAENEKGELIIIEIQNTREVAYFHRMIYGTSKVISERMKLGKKYDHVKKVYSINIVYFELGHGKDYVYHGKTEFRSLHNPDEVLQLTTTQKKQFQKESVGDVFPEYYVIRVEEFDKIAIDPLDEWISFLKTSQIPDTATAPGLKYAREIMALNTMSEEERQAYERHIDNLRYQRSVMETQRIEGREEGHEEGFRFGLDEGRKEGRAQGRVQGRAQGLAEGRVEGREEGRVEGLAEGEAKGRIDIAKKAKLLGLSLEQIKELTDLPVKELENL